MTGMAAAIGAGVALAAGTFAIRLAGPAIASRLHLTERTRRLVDAAAVVILFAVMASSALTDGHRFTGAARPLGVTVAIVLAWCRAPFPLVVLAAAATTAVIRHLELGRRSVTGTACRGERSVRARVADHHVGQRWDGQERVEGVVGPLAAEHGGRAEGRVVAGWHEDRGAGGPRRNPSTERSSDKSCRAGRAHTATDTRRRRVCGAPPGRSSAHGTGGEAAGAQWEAMITTSACLRGEGASCPARRAARSTTPNVGLRLMRGRGQMVP